MLSIADNNMCSTDLGWGRGVCVGSLYHTRARERARTQTHARARIRIEMSRERAEGGER